MSNIRLDFDAEVLFGIVRDEEKQHVVTWNLDVMRPEEVDELVNVSVTDLECHVLMANISFMSANDSIGRQT